MASATAGGVVATSSWAGWCFGLALAYSTGVMLVPPPIENGHRFRHC